MEVPSAQIEDFAQRIAAATTINDAGINHPNAGLQFYTHYSRSPRANRLAAVSDRSCAADAP
jgi:hypothetical protein